MKQSCDSHAPRTQGRIGHGEAGLTLIEMMIVLVIIGIVSTLIVVNVIGKPDEARVTTTKSNLATLATALKTYRLDNGFYPSTEQGLKALVERAQTQPAPQSWPQGGYLSEKPVDAWGHDYVYTAGPEGFELKSLGRDGKPGGEGIDADLTQKG
ncbi:type II secretion system major pseudopilin GspG [Sphingomonas sp.]|uniref:type II secretion system major pseudopilin GspG n=1 Tax=Sphingomonas sp. TaxID=28214 RepID=UPI001B1C389B|nr:type II secretion system major pseudopilin GspG [Sphingomonas sp.]MBO9714893.1 type II secretion system major pseudopilin GspG [Sphingomonas sp.]